MGEKAGSKNLRSNDWSTGNTRWRHTCTVRYSRDSISGIMTVRLVTDICILELPPYTIWYMSAVRIYE